MTENSKIKIVGISFFIALIVLYICAIKFIPDKKTTNDILIEKIIQLESKIDSLSSKKDSIKTVIITVEKEIQINQKTHEKIVNTIINSSDSDNYAFIEQYIEEYKRHHGIGIDTK